MAPALEKPNNGRSSVAVARLARLATETDASTRPEITKALYLSTARCTCGFSADWREVFDSVHGVSHYRRRRLDARRSKPPQSGDHSRHGAGAGGRYPSCCRGGRKICRVVGPGGRYTACCRVEWKIYVVLYGQVEDIRRVVRTGGRYTSYCRGGWKIYVVL